MNLSLFAVLAATISLAATQLLSSSKVDPKLLATTSLASPITPVPNISGSTSQSGRFIFSTRLQPVTTTLISTTTISVVTATVFVISTSILSVTTTIIPDASTITITATITSATVMSTITISASPLPPPSFFSVASSSSSAPASTSTFTGDNVDHCPSKNGTVFTAGSNYRLSCDLTIDGLLHGDAYGLGGPFLSIGDCARACSNNNANATAPKQCLAVDFFFAQTGVNCFGLASVGISSSSPVSDVAVLLS